MVKRLSQILENYESVDSVVSFIEFIFQLRGMANLSHYADKSLAKHLANEELYTALLEKIDEFIEVYQGQYGIIEFKMPESKREEDFKSYLKSSVEHIKKESKNFIDTEDTHLLNIIDEIVASMYRVLYKLENFQ